MPNGFRYIQMVRPSGIQVPEDGPLRSARENNSAKISGGIACTTAAERDLMAVIKAPESLPCTYRTTVHSHSQYLIAGMRYLTER